MIKEINVVLLSAGFGTRFKNTEEFKNKPAKPILPITYKDHEDVPMYLATLENTLNNFLPNKDIIYNIYIIKQSEYDINATYTSLYLKLNDIKVGEIKIIDQEGFSGGALNSSLLLRKHINKENLPILIMNCDQLIHNSETTQLNFENYISLMGIDSQDDYGFLFHFLDKKKTGNYGYSVISTNQEADWDGEIITTSGNEIIGIYEKAPLTEFAHTGHYFHSSTRTFYEWAEYCIDKNIGKINDEHFISPVFQEIIEEHGHIYPLFVDKFHSLGLPEDYKAWHILQKDEKRNKRRLSDY